VAWLIGVPAVSGRRPGAIGLRRRDGREGRSFGIIAGMQVPTTLVVTNDFPPRVGGIQRTLEALVQQLPPDRVGVFCPDHDGAGAYDEAVPFHVFRQPEAFLWPTPEVGRRVRVAAEALGADVVLFGASYPLALLGPRLASTGLPYVAAAHGFEYWLSIAPGTHALLRYATSRAARVAVMCSAFIARTVRTAVPRDVPVSVLYPGADVERFHPDLPTADIRERLGVDGDPLVVCVSRLVARKGQDVLIDAMPAIRARAPGARLLIVGGGPDEDRLRSRAATAPEGSVLFAGQVDEADLPRYYAVGDVFAMPCRTRLGGLEVEGWGNVFIEAAACRKPVVVGDSGGARESLIDGETGILVDGGRVVEVATAVGDLLSDPERAHAMGAAGRARVLRSHTWPDIAERLAGWLTEAVAGR
jgi:phosphatidylinositol alpha-1,6-mannosyltransferase